VIRSQIQIPDHFFILLIIVEWKFFGDSLEFLIQSPANFYDTW